MIKVVEIVHVQSLPQSTRLKECRIFDGKKEETVACGAKNVRENMKTLWAEVGTILPQAQEALKVISLGGVDSHGMLCSAKDLRVCREGGLVDLPAHVPLGTSWEDVDVDLLSSIPWHTYQQRECFYWDKESGQIHVFRKENPTPPENTVLISKTYFDGQGYRYRHFL